MQINKNLSNPVDGGIALKMPNIHVHCHCELVGCAFCLYVFINFNQSVGPSECALKKVSQGKLCVRYAFFGREGYAICNLVKFTEIKKSHCANICEHLAASC